MEAFQVDWMIILITCVFMILDIISGFVGAWKNKNIDSKIMRQGLFHKMGYILVIVLAITIEWAMCYLNLGFMIPLLIPCCAYIVITEVASILENIKEVAPHLANNPLFKLFERHSEDFDMKVVDDGKDVS